MKFVGNAVDMYNGNEIPYPMPKDSKYPRKLKYDFLFTGFGAWRYCSSTNELNRKGLAGMKKAARDKGESWLVIESDTGTVVDSLLVPDMDPNLKAHLVEAP